VRAELQKPVDGPGLVSGGLGHALGGAARGRGQQHARGDGREHAQNGIDDGGFSRARTARDDEGLVPRSQPDRLGLFGSELQIQCVLDPVDGLVRLDGSHRAWRTPQSQHPAGNTAFGDVIGHEIDGIVQVGVQPFDGDAPGRGQTGQALLHGLLVDRQGIHAALQQGRAGKKDMAVVHGLLQHVNDPGLDSEIAVAGKAQLGGNGVRCQKADAVHVEGDPVGVFLHDLQGSRAVVLEQPDRVRAADAVGLQKEHQVADFAVLAPGLLDARQLLGADPFDFEEFVRVVVQDVHGVIAEGLDDAGCYFLAHALDHARLEELPDALDCGQKLTVTDVRRELHPPLGVLLPAALQDHGLARRRIEHAPDNGDRAQMIGDHDPGHGEAVLGVVKREALDDAVQGHRLDRGICRQFACLRRGNGVLLQRFRIHV